MFAYCPEKGAMHKHRQCEGNKRRRTRCAFRHEVICQDWMHGRYSSIAPRLTLLQLKAFAMVTGAAGLSPYYFCWQMPF